MKYCRIISVVICLIILAVSSGHGKVPSLVNYQGRLTDSRGASLDTTADLTFRLYKDSTMKGLLWEETHSGVVIADGLFSVLLGSIVPFNAVFDGRSWYMTTQVNSDPEALPPVPIVMVPYAYRSVHSDTAEYVSNTSSDFVETSGDTMTGELVWDANSDGVTDAKMQLEPTQNAANLLLYTDGVLHSRLWGSQWGELVLYDGSGDLTADLTATNSIGGILYLRNGSGDPKITLRAGETGTDAAWFDEEAIDASEILDEPGVTCRSNFGEISLTTDAQYISLVSTTINIPTPGYILVMGKCIATLYTWRDSPKIIIQIGDEESPTAGWNYNNAIEVHINEDDQYDPTLIPVSIHGLFYRDTPGSYTFYLQAALSWGESFNDPQIIEHGMLTAVFIPTSYGETVATALSPAGFSSATPIPELSPAGTTTVYQVDYRDLELEVALKQAAAEKARADAEAAERRLLEAKIDATER